MPHLQTGKCGQMQNCIVPHQLVILYTSFQLFPQGCGGVLISETSLSVPNLSFESLFQGAQGWLLCQLDLPKVTEVRFRIIHGKKSVVFFVPPLQKKHGLSMFRSYPLRIPTFLRAKVALAKRALRNHFGLWEKSSTGPAIHHLSQSSFAPNLRIPTRSRPPAMQTA